MGKQSSVNFSDKAKRARGIEPSDALKENERLHLELMAAQRAVTAKEALMRGRLERIRSDVRAAVEAMDAGRRGEGMQILRALVRPKDGKLSSGEPAEPDAA